MRVCDQEDCPIYPYEVIKEPEPEPEPEPDPEPKQTHNHSINGNLIINGSITWATISSNNWTAQSVINEDTIRDISMRIKVEELDTTVDIRCLMCSYFKKCDMKTELKVFMTRKALEE